MTDSAQGFPRTRCGNDYSEIGSGLLWKYVGEGGKHALFSVDHDRELGYNDLGAEHSFNGRLLRIPKRLLRMAAMAEPSHQNPILDTTEDDKKEIDSSLLYIQHIAAPFLHPYFDIPKPVELSTACLKAVYDAAMESGNIPAARLKDWLARDMMPYKNDDSREKRAYGMLLLDYRQIHSMDLFLSPSLPPVSTLMLTMELKPKAGYLAYSPLVHPSRRVKYRQSRFVSLQHLQQQGRWTKGWLNNDGGRIHKNTMSFYDPLDLFSMDASRIQRAVAELFKAPQNNLRVWNDQGGMLVSHGWDPKCIDILDSNYANQDVLLQVVLVQVLTSNEGQELLRRILQWQQKLDILDVDGAVLVYERLQELCRSKDLAHQLIDGIEYHDIHNQGRIRTHTDDIHSTLLDVSPFRFDQMTQNEQDLLRAFGQAVSDFESLLETSSPNLPDENQMDEVRNKLIAVIESQLTASCCNFLLRNWLLSLMMCDLSIFVTLQECSGERYPEISSQILHFSHHGLTYHFRYNLHVIDVDPKPAKKLDGRWNKELAFAFLST